MAQQQQIQALITLGWSDRTISKTIGVDRGTVSKYRKKAQNPPEISTDITGNQPDVPTGQDPVTSAPLVELPSTNSVQLHPYIETVKGLFDKRLTAQRIYQDLVEQHDYKGSYDSVKRYVRKLRCPHR